MYHTWFRCDLNPNTTDATGRENRKFEKAARSNKKGQQNTGNQSHANEVKASKAQVAALIEECKSNKPRKEDDRIAMFAALRFTLEDTAASTVNGPVGETRYTTLPRNITDRGASMPFVRTNAKITNAKMHVQPLTTAAGVNSHSTHEGKLQVTGGNNPLFFSALVVPSFKGNLMGSFHLGNWQRRRKFYFHKMKSIYCKRVKL